MYIKELCIAETQPKVKVIRTIKFKERLNLIVDNGAEKSKGNSVGKTTVLKLIDIALGAKEKKAIYTDFETSTDNIILRNYIHESKVKIILKLGKEYTDTSVLKLEVELFKNGKRLINGEKYSFKEYTEKLNEYIFGNKLNNPTFRELIKMFVRIDLKRDSDRFLRYLHNNTSNAEYRRIYNFLFELEDQEESNELSEKENRKKKIESDILQYKKRKEFGDIESLKQTLLLNKNDQTDLINNLKSLLNSQEYLENENQVKEIKLSYSYIKDQIDKLYFEAEILEKNLIKSKNEKEFQLDNESIRILYEETKKIMPDVHKTFDELIRFNQQLVLNKIKFYENKLERTKLLIEGLEKEKNNLFYKHKKLIMLIEDESIEEYSQLQAKLNEISEKIGSIGQIIEYYESMENEMTELKKEIEFKMRKMKENDYKNIEIFNTYFSKYSLRTNGIKYVFYLQQNNFPFSIDATESIGLSTGSRKSLVAAFDIAYQAFSEKIQKKVPNFIIHDVVESIDNEGFEEIINLVNKNKSQFIISVLNDRIQSFESIKENDIIITLSEDDKPFKI